MGIAQSLLESLQNHPPVPPFPICIDTCTPSTYSTVFPVIISAVTEDLDFLYF
jgi:hypothetical protein